MTRIWRWGDPVEPLRELLRRGGVLAIPTESSYGLGADPRNRNGVEAIYRIKGREPRKALPVVVADLEQLAGLGIDPDLSILKVLSACWPGPLTAVLAITRPDDIPAAAGEPTLAVRIPGHEGLRGLLAALGHGLTATSANPSGGEPVLNPRGAADLLAGEDAMVVDGGTLPGGPPSTLVAIEEGGPVVLRTGRFPVERLREVLRAAQGEEA
jgi:L-threonylcarbamoyladenylate synthase